MRTTLLTASTVLLAAGALTVTATQADAIELAPLLKSTDAVPGSYVVVLKSGASDDAAARAEGAGATISRTFTRVLRGYSAMLSTGELAAVRADPAVKYVTPNTRVEQSGFRRQNIKSWGIDRVDQRNLPLDGGYYSHEYYFRDGGSEVDAYVVDTGIYNDGPSAAVLEPGTDLIGTGDGRVDCNGHGTHVAGIINSYSYGMLADGPGGGGVHIYPVRVLDCAGRGTTADALAGLDWVEQQPHGRPAVVNLSLSKGFNQALNDGVQHVIDSGIPVVAAAGDQKGGGVDACTTSPGSVTAAITVAASTSKDAAAGYTNHGPCVDLYAPGDKITSLAPGPSTTAWPSATYSGSSPAAAHVTGAVVLSLMRHPSYTPAQVSAWITSNATPNTITGVPTGTPNRLLFSLEPLPVPAGVSGGDRLEILENLVRPTRLYSVNQAYFLAQRARDSWLCLYQAASGKAVWCNGHSGVYLKMNVSYIATYDSYGRLNWQTAKQGDLPCELIVNGKGYLMIKRISDHKVLWTSPH